MQFQNVCNRYLILWYITTVLFLRTMTAVCPVVVPMVTATTTPKPMDPTPCSARYTTPGLIQWVSVLVKCEFWGCANNNCDATTLMRISSTLFAVAAPRVSNLVLLCVVLGFINLLKLKTLRLFFHFLEQDYYYVVYLLATL